MAKVGSNKSWFLEDTASKSSFMMLSFKANKDPVSGSILILETIEFTPRHAYIVVIFRGVHKLRRQKGFGNSFTVFRNENINNREVRISVADELSKYRDFWTTLFMNAPWPCK